MFFGDAQEPRNRIASDLPTWSWSEALAAARPGARYRIADLVFVMVRDRCRELGLEEGDEVRCVGNQGWAVELERPDRRRVSMEHDYAWFVQVELVGRGDAATGDARSTS